MNNILELLSIMAIITAFAYSVAFVPYAIKRWKRDRFIKNLDQQWSVYK